jgi:DNA-directed RNA polymerase subunit H (RpoH/RPB5)
MSSNNMSESTIMKLWKSRNTIIEILIDRKYLISKSESILDLDDFVKKLVDSKDEARTRKNMMLSCEKRNSKDKINVIWPIENKLGTNIRDIILFLESVEVKRAIIVINDSVTSWGGNFIKHLKASKIYIDVYTLAESQFNITKHFLVPRHVLCSKLEKMKIINAYNTDKQDKLPQIKQCDPIVRHFGACKGDLFRIIRSSETQGGMDSISYRIVN